MLTLKILGTEFWDEVNEKFVTMGDVVLQMEHSLGNLSKWESEFEKPLLSKVKHSDEEVLGYFRCMTLTPNVPPEVFARIGPDHVRQINAYIDAKMTATWFREDARPSRPNTEALTAELIYFWMFTYGIPMECENWHLNKLFTLIRVFDAKNKASNQKPQKLTTDDIEARRRLNEERKREFGTSG